MSYAIPQLTLDAIERYVKKRTPTGDFLTAVLENNLSEAIVRADGDNGKAMREIVMFIYWEIPAICWGSPEKVKAWLEGDSDGKNE